jgi:hypothetical protein
VLAAHRVLAQNPAAIVWIFPAALIVMCVIPSLVFLAVDPPTRVLLRKRWSGEGEEMEVRR